MSGNWRKLGPVLGALEKYKMALAVLTVGIFLLLLPTGGSETAAQPEAREGGFDLAAFEQRLADTISGIDGAGKARVLLRVSSEGRQVLAQDVERDGERTRTTVVTAGQEVVPVQTFGPQFQGAVVVCPGGDDPEVRLTIARAVSAVTGLGSDRISICKGN